MKSNRFPNVEALSKGYMFRQLQNDDPDIQAAVDLYRNDFNLPQDARPSAAFWLGIYDDAELLAVCGERWLAEGVIEITDLYPLPGKGRRGVAALYMALSVLREALGRGVYRQMTATCLFRNKTFQKAIDRVFGCEPMAISYSLETRASAS